MKQKEVDIKLTSFSLIVLQGLHEDFLIVITYVREKLVETLPLSIKSF